MRIWKIGFVALIIFLLLWVSHGLSQAMVSQWLKTYGDIYVESIEQTADGGLIAAGYIQPAGTEPRVACALKLDSNGELQWQKTYANANAPGSTATSIQQTRDGGYILGGGDSAVPRPSWTPGL